LSTWLAGFGPVERVGVEGTGAYGAGLGRHLRSLGVEVIEVDRPNRQLRRAQGKSNKSPPSPSDPSLACQHRQKHLDKT
jgi:transposase